MQNIIGHTRQQKALIKLIKLAKLPSALLFSGDSGIGKKSLAIKIAETLLCHNIHLDNIDQLSGCLECKSCLLIKAFNHPDLMILDYQREEGSAIEATKTLLSPLNYKPFLGERRIVILDNAEEINIQSANVLLKKLEEPGAGTYFILITQFPRRLIATMRSRAQQWSFAPLNRDETREVVHEIAQKEKLKENDIDSILPLLEGTPGNLVAYAHSLDLALSRVHDFDTTLEKIISGDSELLISFTQELGRDKENLVENWTLLIKLLHQKLRKDPINPSIAIALSELISSFRLHNSRNLAPSPLLLGALITLLPKLRGFSMKRVSFLQGL